MSFSVADHLHFLRGKGHGIASKLIYPRRKQIHVDIHILDIVLRILFLRYVPSLKGISQMMTPGT